MKSGKINLSIENKLSQKLMITPQMKQSLNLLQMPVVDLLQEVNTILEENPVIEEMENKSEEEIKEKDKFLEDLKKVEWDDYFQNDDWYYLPSDDDEINFEKFLSGAESLYEHLLFQLSISGLTPEEKAVGEYILGNIDENGYLMLNEDVLSEELNVSINTVERVLDVIREFDPSGIAQSNFCDCIRKQLEIYGVNANDIELVAEILQNHEEDIVRGDFERVAEIFDIDMEGLNKLLSYVKMTDPKPGLKFSSSARYVVPDVYIVERDNKYDVVMNEEGFPSIKLNSYYVKLLKSSQLDEKAREFVEDKVKNALWLLKSLNHSKNKTYD